MAARSKSKGTRARPKAALKSKHGVLPSRRKAYDKLRAKGMSIVKAAKIANKGHTFDGRSVMAKKGARKRS